MHAQHVHHDEDMFMTAACPGSWILLIDDTTHPFLHACSSHLRTLCMRAAANPWCRFACVRACVRQARAGCRR